MTKRTKKPDATYLVWANVKGRNKDIGKFADKAKAISFAKAESILRETSVYVDEKIGVDAWEPIATYTGGRSMRI